MTERPMISFTTATSMMWSGQPSDTAWSRWQHQERHPEFRQGGGIAEPGRCGAGYAADMLLVDDLRELRPCHVFYAGKLVAQEGRLLAEIEDKSYPLESANSVHVRKLAAEDFTIIRLYPREK